MVVETLECRCCCSGRERRAGLRAVGRVWCVTTGGAGVRRGPGAAGVRRRGAAGAFVCGGAVGALRRVRRRPFSPHLLSSIQYYHIIIQHGYLEILRRAPPAVRVSAVEGLALAKDRGGVAVAPAISTGPPAYATLTPVARSVRYRRKVTKFELQHLPEEFLRQDEQAK